MSPVFATTSRSAVGAACPIQWIPGVCSLGLKQPEHEADYSCQSLNVWSFTYIPRIYLHGMLVRHRDNFTFIIFLLNAYH